MPGRVLQAAWFVGADWGSQKHQVRITVAGKVLGDRAFEHGGAGLSEMADWLLSFAAGVAEAVGVAIETPRGPVVESLMEHGITVHSINLKQLHRFRDRLSPAGAKDDRRNAQVLAGVAYRPALFSKILEPTDPTIVELREWSRLSEELTAGARSVGESACALPLPAPRRRSRRQRRPTADTSRRASRRAPRRHVAVVVHRRRPSGPRALGT